LELARVDGDDVLGWSASERAVTTRTAASGVSDTKQTPAKVTERRRITLQR
jgi:hypothetical protein